MKELRIKNSISGAQTEWKAVYLHKAEVTCPGSGTEEAAGFWEASVPAGSWTTA